MRAFAITLLFAQLLTYSCVTKVKNENVFSHPSYAYLNSLVKPQDFTGIVNGKETALYTLTNSNGVVVKITNYGARIVSVLVPNSNGVYEDVVLGYSSIDGYLADYTKQGATIGRYANRIANARFSIDGREYELTQNAGQHILHGGDKAFDAVVWQPSFKDTALLLTYRSPHLDEGFPGELEVSVRYSLTQENELIVEWRATTDRPTHVNISNHTYFNLKGEGNGTVLSHTLMVNADSITEPSRSLIPTGSYMSAEGTPLDFRSPLSIGSRINDPHPLLKIGHGYDHNFVINRDGDGLAFAARLCDPESGRFLEVYTTQPGLQIYTTNFMDESIAGKKNKPFGLRGGICLETQHFPDSPNQPNFPSTLLRPGEEYHQVCVYKFGWD